MHRNGTLLANSFRMRMQNRTTHERLRPAALALVAFVLLGAAGCGFTGTSSVNPNLPSKVSVAIAPQSAMVTLGGTEQFTATVTGASSTAVNWSVNGIVGGSAATGTISSTALYTAPSSMPAITNVTVTATSVSDSQASASATVQLQSGITVNIAPNAAHVTPGGTQTFKATVSGGGNPAVSWSLNVAGGGETSGDAATGTLTVIGLDTATYT